MEIQSRTPEKIFDVTDLRDQKLLVPPNATVFILRPDPIRHYRISFFFQHGNNSLGFIIGPDTEKALRTLGIRDNIYYGIQQIIQPKTPEKIFDVSVLRDQNLIIPPDATVFILLPDPESHRYIVSFFFRNSNYSTRIRIKHETEAALRTLDIRDNIYYGIRRRRPDPPIVAQQNTGDQTSASSQ